MEVQLTLQHAEQLLDFSQKLDINLLDSVVNCLYNSIGQQVSRGAPGSVESEWNSVADTRNIAVLPLEV